MAQLQNLPIDIHYNKLLDWLINRRHCNQNWQAAAVVVREKINKALDDMPEVDEIKQLLEGTHVNYFHCKKIVELLKDTDSGKTNVFGQYSSQKMKDWVEILNLYEKDGVYLAETAQMIARNVNYEVPAFKKQISKCQQMQKDSSRKEADYISNAAELRRKYNNECKQLGIQGKKIKSELSALVQDLPTVYNKISDSVKNVQSACDYYKNFVDYTMKREDSTAESLKLIKYIQENGNTSTYEWRTGTKPDVIQEPLLVVDVTEEEDETEKSSSNLETIDWGDTGGTAEAIDYGDTIDFDVCDITLESGGEGAEGDGASGKIETIESIDWGGNDVANHIEVSTAGSGDAASAVEGVAQGEDALTVLDNPKTRKMFIDDLYELDSFLALRITELECEGDEVLSSSQFMNAPQSIQIDPHKIKEMLQSIQDILQQLMSVKMNHLMLIRNSPRYVDRLKNNLKQLLTLADKMVFLEKEMVIKQNRALDEQKEVEPKVSLLIKKTKEMQKQMEQEISVKYKDRKVNIMGEINTM